ncbi:MAG: hypothetical protein Q8N63_07080, partial [Nanoarchaeota archaeon]|nr:hypothetical protein [Nanoarchaeota archaeon]
SDFWGGLTRQKALEYEEIFRQFPLALSVGGIITTHSGLPNVETLKEINKIRDISEGYDDRWHDIVWKDVADADYNHVIERSCIYDFDFNKRMGILGKNVLIRSHDSHAPEQMFDGRCLTLFTSRAHHRRQTIAIADFTKNKRITSVDDLIIEEI